VTPAPSVDKAMTKTGDMVADSAITAKVKTAMLADSDVKGLQINVETVNGVVTLTGSVDNKSHIDKAMSLTKGIEGVKSVENKLTAKAG
nr:BON domain-containing protein [Betaproteobacteria bacterium]